jgi:anti-sigma factor RsiW
VRCTSCEFNLDRYIEGTLGPREMRATAAHLASCDACRDLYNELHVVDALLATTRTPELPPNFSFAVMAEARALTRPAIRRAPVWAIVAAYLVVAWTTFALCALKFGLVNALRSSNNPLTVTLAHAIHGVSGAILAVSPAMPLAFVAAVAILTIDAMLVCGVIVFYRFIRPHVVARLSPLEVS